MGILFSKTLALLLVHKCDGWGRVGEGKVRNSTNTRRLIPSERQKLILNVETGISPKLVNIHSMRAPTDNIMLFDQDSVANSKNYLQYDTFLLFYYQLSPLREDNEL